MVLLTFAFTTKPKAGYKIGDTIEDFRLKNIDDSMVSLADYSNAKGFIIIFTYICVRILLQTKIELLP